MKYTIEILQALKIRSLNLTWLAEVSTKGCAELSLSFVHHVFELWVFHPIDEAVLHYGDPHSIIYVVGSNRIGKFEEHFR